MPTRFFFIYLFFSTIFSSDILFEGFRATIYENYDKEIGVFSGFRNGSYNSQAIVYNFDSPYDMINFIVSSPNNFIITLDEKANSNYTFDSSFKFLIIVEGLSPLRLKLDSENNLVLHDRSKSRKIIKRFLEGKKMGVRFGIQGERTKSYQAYTYISSNYVKNNRKYYIS